MVQIDPTRHGQEHVEQLIKKGKYARANFELVDDAVNRMVDFCGVYDNPSRLSHAYKLAI